MKVNKENSSNSQCPNCWGYQEYECEVVSMVARPNNPKGWIIEYMNKFLSAG